ncbi:hypothetical protein ABVT39_022259 [Epinephelus coioides]
MEELQEVEVALKTVMEVKIEALKEVEVVKTQLWRDTQDFEPQICSGGRQAGSRSLITDQTSGNNQRHRAAAAALISDVTAARLHGTAFRPVTSAEDPPSLLRCWTL